MKQIQSILSLLLAVCLLLALTACGKDEVKTSEPKIETSTTVEVIPGEAPAASAAEAEQQAQEEQSAEAVEESPAAEAEASAEASPEEPSPVEEEDGSAVIVVPEDMGVGDL